MQLTIEEKLPTILPLYEPQGRARLSPGRHSRNQGGRECCPQRAANVSEHSYKLRAAYRHALPPKRQNLREMERFSCVCIQRAGLRMPNGSGALGTDAPYQ